MTATDTVIALGEIVVHMQCAGGVCCAALDHKRPQLRAVVLMPRDCNDERAERAKVAMESMSWIDTRNARGAHIWLLEQLAALGPLVCGVGGHPVDLGHLTLRLSRETTWH